MSHDRHEPPAVREPGPRYAPLVIVAVAACAGIVVDRYAPISLLTWLSISAGLLVAWTFVWRREKLGLASPLLLLAIATAWAAWHHFNWNLFSPRELGRFAYEERAPVCLEVTALEAPRTIPAPPFSALRAFSSGERSRLIVAAERIRNGRVWQPARGRAALTVDGQLLAVRSGDRLRLFCGIGSPRAPLNPGEFNFAQQQRAERTLAQLWADHPSCVDVIGPGSRWNVESVVDGIRTSGLAAIARYVGPRQYGLAGALLLGVRDQLDFERNEDFLETGTVHVLSISGLHVGIVAAWLFVLLRCGLVPQRTALVSVVAITVLYSIVTDAGAPVIRATVIVAVTCLALAMRLPRPGFNALALAALIVLAINPADLFRAGTQLSFLSVATIAWGAPSLGRLGRIDDPLDRLIAQSRPWPVRAGRWTAINVARALLLSTAIWLITAPLVLARFHVLSPVALGLNLLLWLPVSFALLAGFGVFVSAALLPPLAWLFGGLCDLNLALLDKLVVWGESIPLGHAWLPGPPDWWLAGLYLAVGLAAAFPRVRPPRRWLAALAVGWVGVWLAAAALPRRDDALRCTFLAVGHGLSAVIELPDGQVLLYDAGQLGSPTGVARSVAGYLWSRGITHVDGVVVSHADLDHFNGLPALADKISIGAVYVSPMMFEENAASTQTLAKSLAQREIPIQTITAGDRLRVSAPVAIEVLHPTREGVLGSDNANSVVLAIDYAGRRILLTGDLETPGLEAVVAEEPLDCDVLLAPHHGSASSNPRGMAAWSTPESVVISGGYEVDPQVTAAYRAAGAEVLHTAMTGAVTFEVSRMGVRRAVFRGPGGS